MSLPRLPSVESEGMALGGWGAKAESQSEGRGGRRACFKPGNLERVEPLFMELQVLGLGARLDSKALGPRLEMRMLLFALC